MYPTNCPWKPRSFEEHSGATRVSNVHVIIKDSWDLSQSY